MYLVREKWSKQKSRRLLFRGLWPWAAEYKECSVSGCLFTLQLLHTIGIHQQRPGSAVGSIANHHLVSEKFKVNKMQKHSKCMQEMLSFNWTSWISNFTHYINFIAQSPFNMEPKHSFVLSYLLPVLQWCERPLCSLLWCQVSSGKAEISLEWQSSVILCNSWEGDWAGIKFLFH